MVLCTPFAVSTIARYTKIHMSGEDKKHFRRRPQKSVDGFIGAPVRQERKVITPFMGGKNEAPAPRQTARSLDNFSRPEGYHSFTPRQVGLPATGRQSPASASLPNEGSALPQQPVANSAPSAHGRRHKTGPKHAKLRRRLKRGSLVLVVLIVLVVGFLFAKGYLQLRHVFRGGASHAAALAADVDPSQLKGEGAGRINILLLGIGGVGHDGPDLTDTMLVASIDPVNNKAVLLSVPRDLWIKEPDNYMGNYQKINAAYEAGKYDYLNEENESNANQNAINAGFKTADEAVSGVLGIQIEYNALVDFQAFQQAVNTVGGVTVNVPTELYDPTMAWENNWNPVLAKPGIQTMNGKQALNYVRSRETTSDFARTQRQRAVILALKQKALTLGTLSNPIKISNLLSAFGDNVRTDMSLTDANALYNLLKKINNSNIQSVGLADPPNNYVTTADEDGLSVVEPTAGEFDYSQIQTYVRKTLPDGYLAKENANITVLNGTTVPGLAATEAAVLKSYDYNVGTVADAPTQTYQKTVIVDLTNGKDKYTKNYLQERFGVQAVTTLPDKSIQPGRANFVIIIGEDEATSSTT
jgi:polyisoprenyl-teichoic acid--peptidoglycan teichoic acid transferase